MLKCDIRADLKALCARHTIVNHIFVRRMEALGYDVCLTEEKREGEERASAP